MLSRGNYCQLAFLQELADHERLVEIAPEADGAMIGHQGGKLVSVLTIDTTAAPTDRMKRLLSRRAGSTHRSASPISSRWGIDFRLMSLAGMGFSDPNEPAVSKAGADTGSRQY